MNQIPTNHKQLLNALRAATKLYKKGYSTLAKASFRRFLKKKLPDLLGSICYESLEEFACDDRSRIFWKEKDSQKQLDLIIEYSKQNPKFSDFLVLVGMEIYLN